VLVYEEKDARFNLYVDKSKTKKNLFFVSSSSTTTEYRYLSADKPTEKEKIFMPRVQDVEYYVIETTDRYFVRYKDKENLNGKIFETPLTGFEDKKTWKEVIPHDPAVRLEGIDVLNGYLITEVRKNGLNEINILSLADGKRSTIPFQEPVYTIGLIGNPEIGATTIRYSYISLNRPNTLYEYDLATGESKKLKEQEIPSGFNPDNYVVERLWADAPDGVKVPMAIVYKKGMKKNGNNPALIYSYGSYGSSSDVFFSPVFYSLIDRVMYLLSLKSAGKRSWRTMVRRWKAFEEDQYIYRLYCLYRKTHQRKILMCREDVCYGRKCWWSAYGCNCKYASRAI